jgi:hypothetical protein
MPFEILFGVGAIVLLGILFWGYTRYRHGAAAREQDRYKNRPNVRGR